MNDVAKSGARHQGANIATPADVASPDAIVDALYAALSFKSGEGPDWTRAETLFHPLAVLVPPAERKTRPQAVDLKTYIQTTDSLVRQAPIRAAGLVLDEVARNVVEFGALAHVLSSTETIVGGNEAQPASRGIASLQLMRSGERWWILGLIWDNERPDNPMPPGYLP
ncbi:MAG: hypothetical protein FJX47_12625 [Alphaproteobacteria bacterium]|nr:hypothetical protein [Alphaproteobacteria bacterium]